MFKFDFKVEEEEIDSAFKNPEAHGKEELCEGSSKVVEWHDAKEILCDADIIENLEIAKLNSTELVLGEKKINYMVSGYVLEDIKSHETHLDIGVAEQQHTDLIPGVYEGGAKVWECTEDLLHYIHRNYEIKELNGKHVLDLGCGSGLLGIFVYKCGAVINFQDYNEDVLRKITIPNFLINAINSTETETNTKLDLESISKQARFYAGDWAKFAELTTDEKKFDLIVTAETIYNPENHQKILDTFYNRLEPNGTVLLAAKTYYFGVGGGLRQFEEQIVKDNRFKSNILWISTEGVNREIIEIKIK